MNIVLQSSPEWAVARIGKLTASRIADAIAKTKTGYGASRANLMADLIAERLTGVPIDGYKNAAMQHGIDTEPAAISAYEFLRDATVEPGGFVAHPEIEQAGASPDGFVGNDGLVEVKCQNTATHLDTLLGRQMPAKYFAQVQWQMACTGRAWCDYISFDPRLPVRMQLFVDRVYRQEGAIEALTKEARAFLLELDGKITALNERYAPRAPVDLGFGFDKGGNAMSATMAG